MSSIKGRASRDPKSTKPCDQSSSPLMRLPQELRDELYTWVFSSTRITWGELASSRSAIKPTIYKTKPHALALLYTCRQIYQETRLLWKRYVLFNFRTPEAMLDKLHALPSESVSQIRHVRTNGRPLVLTLPHDDVYYRLAWVMKLLPELRLDTLTVLAGYPNKFAGGTAEARYDTIDGLVQHGNGWKELRYFAPDSSLCGFSKSSSYGEEYVRKSQPEDWDAKIRKRDGAESGASVTIFRSTVAQPGTIVDPRCREVYRQDHPSEDIDYGRSEDKFLMSPAEKGKEMLIFVRRGHNTEIMEHSKPLAEEHRNIDIRSWSGDMAWDEIRRGYTEGFDEDQYLLFGQQEEFYLPEDVVETYGRNADEIKWNEVAGSGTILDG